MTSSFLLFLGLDDVLGSGLLPAWGRHTTDTMNHLPRKERPGMKSPADAPTAEATGDEAHAPRVRAHDSEPVPLPGTWKQEQMAESTAQGLDSDKVWRVGRNSGCLGQRGKVDGPAEQGSTRTLPSDLNLGLNPSSSFTN